MLVHYLRKGLLSLVDASRIMDHAMNLMRGCEYEASSLQVLELASRSACSAYDCEFVALAEDLNVLLVTVDRQILLHFPGGAVSLEAFSSQAP